MMGQEVITQNISAQNSSLTENIGISHLANGLYHAVLRAKNGRFLSHIFVKR